MFGYILALLIVSSSLIEFIFFLVLRRHVKKLAEKKT